MRRKLTLVSLACVLLATSFLATGCFESDADVASRNLSKAAEQFEINRRIVFFNGITDKYLLVVEGKCSVETSQSLLSGSLEVTCKVGDGQFKKLFLGLSDNVSFLVEQLGTADVSTNHYRVIFKPETIVPNFDRP